MGAIKLFIAFGLGAAAGAIGSKLYFEKKAENRADAEIDDVKRHYIKKSISEKTETNDPEQTKKDITESSTGKNPTTRLNYNDISKKEEDKKLKTEHPEEDMPMEPYEITEDEFSQDHIEYDKIALKFYDEDEVLVSEEEELIEADDTIGSDLLDEFIADDRDIMYIRNNATSTDYELRLVYGNYAETMGIE